MITTEKYIRKPLIVDAVRVTTDNIDEIATWCQGEVQQEGAPGQGSLKKYVKVRVHNPKNQRQTTAFIGDWILYTERGYKVYTNKAFHASFGPLEPEPSEPVIKTAEAVIEPIETVPATPESIAQAVQQNSDLQVQDTPTSPPPVADGKRVLTLEEQAAMDQEEIRELIRSGEVVLAQDLAA